MELVYVTRAIRRYWWLTLSFVVLATAAAVATVPAATSLYETESWIQVRPSNNGLSADRNVENNLVLLASDRVAVRVADEVAGATPFSVREAVEFEVVPSSDVIRIVVQDSSPGRAQVIANAYVDAYLVTLREQVQEIQAPRIASIESRISELQVDLDDLDLQIQAAMLPYTSDPDALVVPTIDQVEPGLASRHGVLLDEYMDLLRVRNEMRRADGAELPTQTQLAELPSETAAAGVSLQLLAAPFLGALMGVIAATLAARMSSRILDAEEAESILQRPIAAVLPRSRAVPDAREILLGGAPPAVAPTIHELCVQIEAGSTPDTQVIVVAGAEPVAGVTSLAAELASRMASERSNVFLIDADTSDPGLSRVMGEGVSGVRRLVRTDASQATRPLRSGPVGFSAAGLSHVRFAGLGDEPISRRFIDRKDVDALLRAASQQAPVVVVDAGHLMDAASSVQLAHHADVVVLAIPERHQSRAGLEVVARQLTGLTGTVVPVMTPVSRRRSKAAPLLQQSASDVDADVEVELDDDEPADRSERSPEPTPR